MQIKTQDGTFDVASKNLANTALGLGIAGLATSVLGGGASLMGITPNGRSNTPDERPVTKSELDMAMQLAQKDSTIALLQSEKTTDAKLVDVYKASTAQDKEIRALINEKVAEQMRINAEQATYNATANSAINVLRSQVDALNGVTKVFIPSTNICQQGCGCVGANA